VTRVALVSGANRGIGAEVARQLAADHGFQVLAGARDPSEVEAAGKVTPVQLDVTDQASVDAALERIGSDPGRLDVLVNNAGIFGPVEGVAEIDLNEVGRVFEVNTIGAIRLSQAVMPLLRESDHPRIVNVSSGAGQLSDMDGGHAAYRVSKAGLNAVTRIIAADEGGSSLLVNSLCPGWVRTDMGGPNARRSVEEGADTAVWLATLPDGGPTAGFFRDREPIPW
jgi:NAD(P)-dependent dehydrogenase (short-subunit alcohol dehydrogenase family)